MGQFSWILQDTGEALRESYGCNDKEKTTAYLHDSEGNVWEETRYGGYGVFGGKDYYELLAEMNGIQVTGQEIQAYLETCSIETKEEAYTNIIRSKGIALSYPSSAIRNWKTHKIFQSSGVDFFNWHDEKLVDGLSANELLKTDDWERIDLPISDKILFPNLTRKKEWVWRNQAPEDDPNQGWGGKTY